MKEATQKQTGGHPKEAPQAVLESIGAPQLEEAQQAFALGQFDDAYALLTRPPAEPDTCATPPQKAEAALLLGKLLRERGSFEEAKAAFEEALGCARLHDLPEPEANALNQLASVFALQGDAPSALKFLEQAGVLFERLGQKKMWANVLTNAGSIYRDLSEYQDALVSLRKAYDLLKECDPGSRSAAINLQDLGLTYAALGKFERAKTFYEEALDIAAHLNDHVIEIVSRINLAEVYLEMGKLEAAEASFETGRALSVDNGLAVFQLNAVEGLGNVYYRKALFARAKTAHQQAVDLATAIDDKASLLSALLNLAKDELATRSFGEATARALAALLIAEQTERPRALYEAHKLLASAYKAQGAFEKAVYHLEAFHDLKERIFSEENEEKTRRLTLKFDLEKIRYEAEEYRLRSEVSKRAFEEAERLVQERTADLEEAQIEIVTRLAVAAEYRDDDTGVHTRRVGRTAALIAYVLGWPLKDVQLLYTAARLHDVGKIGVSDTILLKPGKLTDEEFGIMRTHPAIGARILADGHSPLLHLAEKVTAAHHERWDGRGYPNKLAGEDIPQAARIVSVADVLDALTHERPYKAAWSVEETLQEIARNSGSQFDPAIVSVCLEVFGASGLLSPLEVAESWQALLADLSKLEHLRALRTGGVFKRNLN